MYRTRIRPAAFTAAAGRLATLLLPPQCVLCRRFADTTDLCATCWDGLTPIAAPLWARCGLPLGHTLADPLCAGFWTKPPPGRHPGLFPLCGQSARADSALQAWRRVAVDAASDATWRAAFHRTCQRGDAGHPGTTSPTALFPAAIQPGGGMGPSSVPSYRAGCLRPGHAGSATGDAKPGRAEPVSATAQYRRRLRCATARSSAP